MRDTLTTNAKRHTHTHIHAHMITNTNAHLRALTQEHTHTRTNAHTHKRTHAHRHTYTHQTKPYQDHTHTRMEVVAACFFGGFELSKIGSASHCRSIGAWIMTCPTHINSQLKQNLYCTNSQCFIQLEVRGAMV